MAIIRFTDRPFFRNPWTDFERMRRELDSFGRWFEGDLPGAGSAEVYPALNISEDKDNVYVRAEVPGVPPVELEISVEGETLIIKGERKACPADEKTSFHRREIECGRFSRAVTLPTRVKVEKIGAASKNGILKITLPKAEEVKPRQIKVDVA
jgi:HSP20 family protein